MTFMLFQVSDVRMNAADTPNAEYVIQANQKFVKNHINDVATDYLKIIVPSDGIMTITFNGASMNKEQNTMASGSLRDANKQLIAEGMFLEKKGKPFSVVVKKGEVFYLEVLVVRMEYSASYTIKKVKSFSNATSRKKAPTLKKNKTVKGLICNSDKEKNAKWYKFNVKKKSNVKVTLKYKGHGMDYDMALYNKKGKKIESSQDQKTLKKKLKKGTYYIKVGKSLSNYEGDLTAGTYTLKWK